jgi:hypothetical protein
MEEKRKIQKSNTSQNRTSNNNLNSNRKNSNSKVHNKKYIKQKKIRGLFVFFFFAIFILGGVLFLLNFEAFNLKEIKVNGTEHYDTDEFVQKLNIKYEDNIFKQIYYLYKSDYSEFAYIESMKPKFLSNNTILLDIVERESSYIAFNKENNKYYRLDKNGIILEECKPSSQTSDEVIITGISFDNEVVLGTSISDVYLKKINSYLEIKKEYENTELKNYGSITKVNFNNSLTTITINDKLNVTFQNDKNLTYYMSLLIGIIQKLPEDSVGTIDMTKENPVYSAY